MDKTIDHSEQLARIEIGSTLHDASTCIDLMWMVESWGFREFLLLFEEKEECIVFYSQCNFQGKSY